VHTQRHAAASLTYIGLTIFASFVSQPSLAGLGSDLEKLRSAYNGFAQRGNEDPDPARPPQPAKWSDATCKKTWSTVAAMLDLAEKAHADSSGRSTYVGAGFTGDSAGMIEHAKASIEGGITIGTYPGEFSMDVGATLDFKRNNSDEELSEDVTSIKMSYDHYFTPKWEGFAFFERFSDSFMQIDQRYEVGTGLKWEKKFRHQPSKIEGAENLKKAIKAFVDAVEADKGTGCLLERNWAPIKVPDSLKGSTGAENRLFQHLEKGAARAEVGISAALLAEFEQSDTLNFTTLIGSGLVTSQTAKPGDKRYRLSVRPSGKWNVSDEVSFALAVYLKPALDAPRKVNGVRDYRIDARAAMDWKIKSGEDKDVSVVLSYDWHYDSVPPNSLERLSEIAAASGVTTESIATGGRLYGEKRHSIAKLQIKLAR
jgi:hypothetical protein